jgi:type VI secretion system protein VasG
MNNVDLRALVGKLNDYCRRALEGAAGLCLSKTNYEVEVEHFLLKLSEPTDGDIARIFKHWEINPGRVTQELMRALDRLKTGNSRAPSLSPRLPKLLRDAWVLSSVQYDLAKIRSGVLLTALLSDEDGARLVYEVSRELRSLSADALVKELPKVIAGSVEDEGGAATAALHAGGGAAAAGGAATSGKTPALDSYTIDLTLRAKQGHIDPILGRDAEIRQMIDILMRRRKNNPILTGEAGVGKTAVVEGLAQRIAEGDVPESLRNVAIRTLDLGLLQAGAGIKGEFENRLKSVIAEVKGSAKPIVLFIDEAHTLIGAGGQAGGSDAANLLKPALARGELRTVAATTWSEYKKYFEKDAALERRFQVVKVEEPTEDLATIMIRGLAKTMEAHHNVRILDEAVESAVKLSSRYISGRQLPDKAVDLIDTAATRVAIGHAATPPAIDDRRRRVQHLTAQLDILAREEASAGRHGERIAALTAERAAEERTLADLEARWKDEARLVGAMRAVREQLETGAGNGTPLVDADRERLRADLARLDVELTALQGETPLMQVCVDRQSVSEVVSAWTGIPVGKMLRDEIKTVLGLSAALEERVVGQTHALDAIAQRVRTSRASLDDPNRPVGVFLLVGPSGVGKTETAIALAETLYGGERNMIVVNMSEYQEAHTVSRLKGSPPGYVGYGEGGVLTNAVRQRPYSVVLMDEVEKAHQDVLELFYQVFDKGTLEDGESRVIDFKNTIILMTSNLGTDTIMKLSADPETRPDGAALAEAIRPALLKFFAPALLGRMIVVPYYPISDDVMRRIVLLKLGKVGARLRQNHGIAFDYDDAVVTQIAARCTEVESGARNVDHIITGTLLPEMSRDLLGRMAAGEAVKRLQVGVDGEGRFTYALA